MHIIWCDLFTRISTSGRIASSSKGLSWTGDDSVKSIFKKAVRFGVGKSSISKSVN